MTGYWPWWLGAIALGIVAVGFWGVAGRLLGVSGSFSEVAQGSRTKESGSVSTYPWSAHAGLLIAIALGGTLGALTRGPLRLHTDLGPTFAHLVGSGWQGLAALLVGGLFVGFGTAMAGGCTSGHGLCGTSRLQAGSIVATAGFFGAAVAVSLALARLA